MQTTQLLPSPSGATREDYLNDHGQRPSSRSSPARQSSSQSIRYHYARSNSASATKTKAIVSAAGDGAAPRAHSINNTPVAAHNNDTDYLSLSVSTITQDENVNELLIFLHNQELRFEPELARSYSILLSNNGYDDVIAIDEAPEDKLQALGIKIGHVDRMKRAASREMVPMPKPVLRHDTAQNNSFFSPDPSTHRASSANGQSVSRQKITNATAKAQIMNHMESIRKLEIELSSQVTQPMPGAQAPEYVESRRGRRRDVPPPSSSSSRVDGRGNTATSEQPRLTAEERLEAHKARKDQENKHREEKGKWQSPAKKKKKTNLIDKVPRNDAMVEQLQSNAQDRRRISKMKQQVDKAEHDYRNAADVSERPGDHEAAAPTRRGGGNSPAVSFHHDTVLRTTSSSSRTRPHSQESTISKAKQSALRQGLGVTPDTRRHSREASRAEKRTPGDHKMGKSTRRMSSESGPAYANGDVNESERSISVDYATQNRLGSSSQARCDTCRSTDNLDEDSDNPGVFYCKQCWDEYEYESSTSFGDRLQEYTELRGAPQSVPEDKRMRIQREPEPHQEPQKPPPNNDRALWIVHDNPQLGNQVIVSGPKQMTCMLETKEPGKKNCVRILLGTIDYSGPVSTSDVGGARVPDIEAGAECLRIRSVRGYLVDHSTVESRKSSDKSIYEFYLDADDAMVLTGGNATMTAKEFLQGCDGSVDVIIDPQSSSRGWYPQREASEGSVRKLAPQFRSKGVGYIRLGDDMSKNGQAFLSGNGCKTFFSNPTVNAPVATRQPHTTTSSRRHQADKDASLSAKVDPKTAPKSRQHSSSDTTRGTETRENKSRQQKQLERQIIDFSDDEDMEDDFDDDGSLAESTCTPVDDARDILKQLETTKEMKWDEKADLITRLSKVLAGEESPKDQCSAALNIIQDLLGGKNVTVHVLRAAVKSVGDIGERMGHDLVAEASWKPIMLGMLTNLRNKQCSTVARQILNRLHGQCWTLANSLSCLSHSLGLGKEGAGSGRRASARMTSALKTANNVEVLEWLAGRVEEERKMTNIIPMADKSCLVTISKFFLSHVGHRDPRCRRSVVDGLLHTIIYGIDRLGLKIDESHAICEDYKSTNPRGWESLKANVCKILDEGKTGKTGGFPTKRGGKSK